MTKKVVWMLGIGLLATLAAILRPSGRATLPARSEHVVRRADLAIEVPLTGTIAAGRSIDLTAPISSDPHFFKISRIASEGATIEAGQVVMELDSLELSQKLAEYQAEKTRLEEESNKRKLEYDLQIRDLRVGIQEGKVTAEKARQKLDVPLDLMSGNERRLLQIEAAQADQDAGLLASKLEAAHRLAASEIRGLETMLSNVRSRIEQAEARRIACSVKAPISGTLVYKVMSNGAKRKVGEQTCHHEVILQIPDLSTLRLEAAVEENYTSRIAPGQTVRIHVDAMPDENLTGTIDTVGGVLRIKRFDVPVKIVDVIVQLHRIPSRLSPGMTANGQVEIERVRSALLVPFKAIERRGEITIVRVLAAEDRVVEQAVKLGRRNQEFVEVLEGLSEGQRLVL